MATLILKARTGLTQKKIQVKHPKTGKVYEQTVWIRSGEKTTEERPRGAEQPPTDKGAKQTSPKGGGKKYTVRDGFWEDWGVRNPPKNNVITDKGLEKISKIWKLPLDQIMDEVKEIKEGAQSEATPAIGKETKAKLEKLYQERAHANMMIEQAQKKGEPVGEHQDKLKEIQSQLEETWAGMKGEKN